MPPYTLPDLLAPLGRLRCLLRPACAVYVVMLAAFVALGLYVLNDAQARATRAALARADNLARVFAERFEGTLRRIDGELKQFVAFLPPDALSDAGARRYQKQYEAQFRLSLDNFPEIGSRNVVNARGDSVYRAGAPSPIYNDNFSDRDWFIALRDTPGLTTVISDVITARASGKRVELAARATRRQPHLAVVLVSGFTDGRSGRNSEKYPLLDKPLGKSQLQQALRAAIAQAQAADATPQARKTAA